MDDADRLNSPLLPPRFLPGAPDEPFRFQGIPGIEVTRGGNRRRRRTAEFSDAGAPELEKSR